MTNTANEKTPATTHETMGEAQAQMPNEGLVEEGEAFARLHGLKSLPSTRRRIPKAVTRSQPERLDVIVIGGGQAGLSVGYYLKQRGLCFQILDASERVGDSWRKRWDSLRLFTPARFNGLVGMPFPAHPDDFPTKDEMANYLERYAKHFELPVRSSVTVERLFRRGDRYVVEADGLELEADQVVVAMANYQRAKVPRLAERLDPEIVQLHSSAYKNPAQLVEGPVLIAGAGNSGSEIAMELAERHDVWMVGRDVGHLPFRPRGLLGRLFLVRLVLRFLFHRVLTIRNPLGRKARRAIIGKGGPLIRVKPKDLARAGVRRGPRVVDVEDGQPVLEDGRRVDVKNVVWCTGYDSGFSWIDLPVFGDDGHPAHVGGVVHREPGVYFVGQHFLYSLSSVMVHGVSRDAERIVTIIASRKAKVQPARMPALQPQAS